MRRTATVILSLAILPGLAAAQQAGQAVAATHTVAEGETLWDLATRYYGDPFQWPRIFDANRGAVVDPHVIVPGQALVIPSATAQVQQVVVTTPEQAPLPPPPSRPLPERERSVFYPDTAQVGQVEVLAAFERMAVAPEISWSAPWLLPPGSEPESVATVEGLAAAGAELRRLFFPFDRIRLRFDGATPPVGTRLQLYRMGGVLPELGQVATPTALVTVTEVVPAGAVAVVTEQFGRARSGDLVRPVPPFLLRPGQLPQDVPAGDEAVIVGFPSPRAIRGVGDLAFLDRGSAAGVRIGDEFVVDWNESPDWPGRIEGRLQVVAVQSGHATARIVELRHPVVREGVVVRLVRRIS